MTDVLQWVAIWFLGSSTLVTAWATYRLAQAAERDRWRRRMR